MNYATLSSNNAGGVRHQENDDGAHCIDGNTYCCQWTMQSIVYCSLFIVLVVKKDGLAIDSIEQVFWSRIAASFFIK
jgi:hypothetical protein